jgi:peptide-methionine (S)-S-oxide reductase
MLRRFSNASIRTWIVLPVIGLAACSYASPAASPLPNPVVDTPVAGTRGAETAVLAGGCFWGVEAVFEHVKGVTQIVSGYSGGAKETAEYYKVSSGGTGHAESVRITYDPSRITYGQLLKVYFSVAHDPTELNRQGPDVGTQYRSAVFYANDEQERVAKAYIAQLEAAKAFARPIVTQVVRLRAFYPAESYHQDYLEHHPDQPYIVINDLPKLAALQRQFPDLYTAR